MRLNHIETSTDRAVDPINTRIATGKENKTARNNPNFSRLDKVRIWTISIFRREGGE